MVRQKGSRRHVHLNAWHHTGAAQDICEDPFEGYQAILVVTVKLLEVLTSTQRSALAILPLVTGWTQIIARKAMVPWQTVATLLIKKATDSAFCTDGCRPTH